VPPHCDSLDGPVVTAARRALETGHADPVLPYVAVDDEAEVRDAFDRAVAARASADGQPPRGRSGRPTTRVTARTAAP
jgi:hypothetical protein